MSSIEVAWNPRSAKISSATARSWMRRCSAGSRTGSATRLQGHLVAVVVVEVAGEAVGEVHRLVVGEREVGCRRGLADVLDVDAGGQHRRERGVGEDAGDRGLSLAAPGALPEEGERLGL